MKSQTIRTGVDDLLDILKKTEKMPLADAAHELGVTPTLLQSWVDFLVEEEIIGVEYKFTKPIIYLNKPPEGKIATIKEEGELGIDVYKDDFKARASKKNIPKEKVSFLWQNHVKVALNRKRDFFFREARKRNLTNAEYLWKTYRAKLLLS